MATIYFGVGIAEHYWRYVEFRDTITHQALVAPSVPDPTIRRRIEAKAEDLGLPVEAKRNLNIDRRPGDRIIITTWYEVPLELPGTVKIWRFEPRAEALL